MGIFGSDKEKQHDITEDDNGSTEGILSDNKDHLQRHLNNRQIQLIAIGGSIGTALFVSIGTGLYRGGPGNLLFAFTAQSLVLAMINNCLAEMTVAYPVSGGFIRLAGHFVDDALGFAVGWNFLLYEALLIPFEVTAFTLVLSFWSAKFADPGPIAGVCAAVIICYGLINILAVGAYGEAEFWLSGGKVLLIFMLFGFVFITMVGGNPLGDAYGFRNWTGGQAFRAYSGTGGEGFLAALWSAAFTVVGPEYISMVSAEALRPRVYIKAAFKVVYVRFAIFFIGGALAVGIACPSRDPQLEAVVTGGSTGDAASSPYVIAMQNLMVPVFPHVVNALMLSSIFSAGNTYTYCSVRNLYGLALEGRAPKFLTYTTRKGVPLYCFGVIMLFPMLAFLQCSSSSAIVISWLVSLITAGALIDFFVVSITYIYFHRACTVQGLDRKQFAYTARFPLACAYFSALWMFLVCMFYGYAIFKPGSLSVTSFFQNYAMQVIIPSLYVGWKILKKTKVVDRYAVDLVWERPTIDAYEATFLDPPVGFWKEMIQLIGIKRNKGGNERRRGSIVA